MAARANRYTQTDCNAAGNCSHTAANCSPNRPVFADSHGDRRHVDAKTDIYPGTYAHVDGYAQQQQLRPRRRKQLRPRRRTTVTPTSTATVTPTSTATVTPTSTATLAPVSVSVPPAATVKPVSTQIPGTRIAARPDPGRHCIPHHAAAPIRLCQTGSGSGWWIYDARTGQILHDNAGRLAHVPFNERLPAGQVQVLFKSSRLLAVWLGNQVVISTTYANGKAYVFSIFTGGRTAHWNW